MGAHPHPPYRSRVTAKPPLGRGVSPPAVKMETHTAGVLRVCRALRWGALEVTFYGAPAHQVGEGEVQGPVGGEVGLG